MKKIYTEESIADIADAIREKNREATQYKTSEMAPAILALGSAREVLNGIIKQYKAAVSTVSPDTFIQFVKSEYFRRIADTEDITSATGSDTVATAIPTNPRNITYDEYDNVTHIEYDALVCYRNGDYVYGAVCRFADDTLTVGQPVQITTIAGSWIGLSTFFVSWSDALYPHHTRVYIAHSSSNGTLGGVICDVSEFTITPGTDTNFANVPVSAYPIRVVNLHQTNRSDVLVTYGVTEGETDRLMGVAVNTSGSTPTLIGSPVTLATGAGIAREHIVTALGTGTQNEFMLAHPSGGTSHNYLSALGVVCSFSNSSWTITPGTDQLLIETDGAGECLIQAGEGDLQLEGYVLICHSSGSSTKYVNAIGVQGESAISGFPIDILASDTTLIQVANAAQGCAVSTRRVRIYYGYQNESYQQGENNLLFTYRDGDSYKYVEHLFSFDSRETPSWNWTLGQALPLSGTNQASNYVCTETPLGYDSILDYGEGYTYMEHTALLHSALATYSYGTGMRGSIITYEQTVQPSVDKIEGVTQTECSTSTAGNVWILDEE